MTYIVESKISEYCRKEEKPMQLKKVIALFSAIVCLFSLPNIHAYAASESAYVDEGISLAYEIADGPSSNLSIQNGTAYCISSTSGKNAVSITVTQTLQMQFAIFFWIDVEGAQWTQTNNNKTIRVSGTKSGLESGTYRLKSEFTLTNENGKSETITLYSSEKSI